MKTLADRPVESPADPCERWPELAGGEIKFRVHGREGGMVIALRGPLDGRFAIAALPIPVALQLAAGIVQQVGVAMVVEAQRTMRPPGGDEPRKIGLVP